VQALRHIKEKEELVEKLVLLRTCRRQKSSGNFEKEDAQFQEHVAAIRHILHEEKKRLEEEGLSASSLRSAQPAQEHAARVKRDVVWDYYNQANESIEGLISVR
jgi:hypothetical protein